MAGEIDQISQALGRFGAQIDALDKKMDMVQVQLSGELAEVRDEVKYAQRDIRDMADKVLFTQKAADKANERIDQVRVDLDGTQDVKGLRALVGEHEAIKNKGFFFWALLCAFGSVIVTVVANVLWGIVKPLVMGDGSEPPMPLP